MTDRNMTIYLHLYNTLEQRKIWFKYFITYVLQFHVSRQWREPCFASVLYFIHLSKTNTYGHKDEKRFLEIPLDFNFNQIEIAFTSNSVTKKLVKWLFFI